MKPSIMLLVLLLAGAGGLRSEVSLVLATVAAVVGPGQPVRLELIALNPQPQEMPWEESVVAAGVVKQGDQVWPVTLRALGPRLPAIPASGFVARRYQFDPPARLVGEMIVEVPLADGKFLRTVISVADEGPEARGETSEATSTRTRITAPVPASSALARNFAGRFMPNQPMYFLYGDGDQAAKFQLSFDYRLATLRGVTPERPSIDTLRIGYTQRSLWDLDGDSSPFYDTSYLPEIAYQSDRPLAAEASRVFTWMGWRAGMLHESNGREGADSRSLNTAYVRPRFVLGALGEWALVMLPEVHLYLGESDENPDIEDYRGHGRLRFYFGHNRGPSLMFTGWAGKSFEHGTYQLDLAVPTRWRGLNLETYFHVQYFNGYGESLRGYRLRSEAVRAGFGLVR